MDLINLDTIFMIQSLYQSVGTLSVMTDATSRTFDEMHKWHYTTKDEMKHLGATFIQMRDKFVELMIIGISKMVEDFFNDLSRAKNSSITIWDSTFIDCRFFLDHN